MIRSPRTAPAPMTRGVVTITVRSSAVATTDVKAGKLVLSGLTAASVRENKKAFSILPFRFVFGLSRANATPTTQKDNSSSVFLPSEILRTQAFCFVFG